MDDLSDPREVSRDTGEDEYGALTDDEPELTLEERQTLEKAEAIRNRLMQKKFGYDTSSSYTDVLRPSRPQEQVQRDRAPEKRIQVRRSPSPKPVKRFKDNDTENRHTYSMKAKSSSPKSSQKPPIEPTFNQKPASTSYFLEQLENSRLKSKEQTHSDKKLMSSRTYAFGQAQRETEVKSVDEIDLISGQRLSKRYIPHSELVGILKEEEIKVLRLNKLFAKVTPPNFEEPQYPNWCMVGIIGEKSDPMMSNTAKGKSERFVAIKVTDFKYSVDLSIWGASVIEKYNKLRVGDIIAVLNPMVFTKYSPTGVSGGGGIRTFGLSLKHGDSILEIGQCRNFGFCKSKVAKTGLQCKNFVDVSKARFCAYHNEKQINKVAGSRMEFQGSIRPNAYVNNGIQQTMYLGKPDKKMHGKVQVEIIDDWSAPKTDYVSKNKSHFKSDESHAAFYGHILADKKKESIENHKKRLRKDYELRKKLSENFREGEKLKKLDSAIDDDAIRDPKIKSGVQLLKTAFTSEQLNNLGFDPSSRPNQKGLLSVGRNDKDALLQEFRDITKNKKIDLGLDEQEVQKRKKMRQDNEEMIQRLKNQRYSQYKKLPPIEKPKSKKDTNNKNDINLSDSSDEELEIESKSFTNFKKLAQNDQNAP